MMYPQDLLSIEIIYSLIIILISAYVFFKTQQMYNVMKHPGIYYFSYIFFFLGLTFFLKSIFLFLKLNRLFAMKHSWFFFVPAIAYTSTMCILLILFRTSSFSIFNTSLLLNSVALSAGLLIIFFRNPFFLLNFQIALIIVALLMQINRLMKSFKKNIIYIVTLIILLLNLRLVIFPKIIFLNYYFFIVIASLLLFGFLLYRIGRLVK